MTMTSKEAAKALAEVIRNLQTDAVNVAGSEYVLTLNTGERQYGPDGGQCAFAYDLADVASFLEEHAGKAASYSEDFCARLSPTVQREVAIHVAAVSEYRLTTPGACMPVLNDEEYALVQKSAWAVRLS